MKVALFMTGILLLAFSLIETAEGRHTLSASSAHGVSAEKKQKKMSRSLASLLPPGPTELSSYAKQLGVEVKATQQEVESTLFLDSSQVMESVLSAKPNEKILPISQASGYQLGRFSTLGRVSSQFADGDFISSQLKQSPWFTRPYIELLRF